MEYPKSLYHHVIVSTPEDESAARAEGYRMLCEPENVPMTDKLAEKPKRRGRPPKPKDA